MADIADGSIASWVQAGGVVAFATAVLFELRALRPIMGKVETLLAQLLERERMRSERSDRLRPSSYPASLPRPPPLYDANDAPLDYRGVPTGEFDDETPPLGSSAATTRIGRAPTPARGYRAPARPPKGE